MKLDKISNIILGLIFLFPILPFNYLSILLIALTITVAIEAYFKRCLNYKISYKPLFFSSLFYLILILTLFYSDNLKDGIKEVQKSIPIILIPFVFFLKGKLSKHWIKFYLLLFVFANFAFLIILYSYFLQDFFLGCHYEMSLLPNKIKIRYLFDRPFYELMWCSEKSSESYLFIHKVYNSMHLLFCNLSIYYLLKRFQLNKWIKATLVFLFILFSLMIVNMVSLVNLFLLIIFLILLLYVELKNIKSIYIRRSIFVFIILIFYLVCLKIDTLGFINKELDWQPKEQIITEKEGIGENLLQSRFYINLCNIDIVKNNLFFGVGIGDLQDSQNTCYLEMSKSNITFNMLYQDNLNAHNQYFSYLIAGGIPLLVAFVLLLFHDLKKEYLKRNYLFVSFILLVTVNFLFESMLTRMYGIIFFSLFYSLLLNNNSQKS